MERIPLSAGSQVVVEGDVWLDKKTCSDGPSLTRLAFDTVVAAAAKLTISYRHAYAECCAELNLCWPAPGFRRRADQQPAKVTTSLGRIDRDYAG